MIEYADRAKTLPAPPHIVWRALVEPHQPGTRPWLDLLPDEVEPRVLEPIEPDSLVWSSLWPERPDDEVHFALSRHHSGCLLRFRLLTPTALPDEGLAMHLRRRMSQLLYAELRYSFGQ